MFGKVKPELDKIFENGSHYGQEAFNTPQGVIYDPLMSELSEAFWADLQAVMVQAGVTQPQAVQFLSRFQEELRLNYPYLNKVAPVRPHFEEAIQRTFADATF